ncbi:universal stress protein [Paraburkholderia caballeronis]|uniref:universal stress protein n=1 Tax=Paraburkholderia caballeronis TaxID=416943 RepID=UPI001066F8EC|nr:universal stress protein [Paraburkholderia caballeronis]TDV11375.1 nucleotide-binding universal stress UspA family protein [Paraburkholderia caballeronis]TDV14565.1 nucleotide-binding universal stress UspA family protein [Paraburkholderia caballeronis]TDV23636.1 nucleotide-binding universal stress UspA family protein [Paraburkholderia caballeronis]
MDSEPAGHGPNAFTRVIAAAEGAGGLATLAGFASRLAAPDARFRLVDLIANPAALFPALKLSLPDWADTHAAMVRGAQAALALAAQRFAAAHCVADAELLDLAALRSRAPDALANAAREWRADLVALGAHPRGHRWACRIDPEEVAAVTHCPVLYVPIAQLALSEPPLDRALIAIDGSPASLDALRLALAVLPPHAQLRVVYVVDRSMQPGARWLNRFFEMDGVAALSAATPLLKARGAHASTEMIATADEMDDVPSAILRDAKAWQADLVVTGLQGRHGRVHSLPGSVASRALRDTTCPLLVSPPRPDTGAAGAPGSSGAEAGEQVLP